MARDMHLRAEISARDRASSVLANLGGSFGRLTAAIGIGNLAAQGFSRAMDQLSNSVKFAINSASQVEDSRIAFETMLGSADKAEKMLQELSDFAVKTPFTLPTIREGAKQILAYGVSAEEILPTIKALGDISAGVGRDKLPFLVLALGQVRAAGRLMGTELRQFTEAGVPLLEALSKKLGKTTAQIRDDMERGAGPSFKVVQETIFDMTEEGGKFFNLMQRQSKTFGGVMSNVQDQLGRVSREIVGIDEKGNIKEGGIFFKLKRGAEGFLSYLNTHSADITRFFADAFITIERLAQKIGELATQVGISLGPKLEALWGTLSTRLLPALEKLWDGVLKPLVPLIGTALVIALGLAIDALNVLITVLSPVIDWLGRHKEIVYGVIGGITAWYALLKATAAFNVFYNSIALANAKMVSMAAQAGSTRGALTLLNNSLVGFSGWGVFAAAGVAAFIAIKQKGDETLRVMDDMQKKVGAAQTSRNEAIIKLRDLARKGTPEQQRRAKESLKRMGFASGTNYFSGGTALVGEKGPELVNLPRGSGITSNPKTERIIRNNQPTVNITIQAGAFMGSQQDARKYAMMIMSAYRDVQKARGMA